VLTTVRMQSRDGQTLGTSQQHHGTRARLTIDKAAERGCGACNFSGIKPPGVCAEPAGPPCLDDITATFGKGIAAGKLVLCMRPMTMRLLTWLRDCYEAVEKLLA
jgi:hypothetical protein